MKMRTLIAPMEKSTLPLRRENYFPTGCFLTHEDKDGTTPNN